jgi:CheY-like chemotaxis protein
MSGSHPIRTETSPHGGGMKLILLVDDCDTTHEAYAELLRWGGYRTLCARDGREACEMARQHRPALVVMDLNMPVLDGWEAVRALRADPATARIPVVALSARVLGAAELAYTRECGFEEVWSKPMLPSALLREISRYTDPTEQVQVA